MARTKPKPNMEQQDVDLRHANVDPPARYRVSLSSRDPDINVTGWLIGKPTDGTPKPKYTAHERPGDFDLVQYVGHEPFEQAFPIKFDGEGERSVEAKITDLHRLMRRTAKGDTEPPVVKVLGNGVLHPEYNWRVVAAEEDIGRRLYLPDGDRRLYVAVVSLRQQVTERVLAESIRAFRRKGRGPGIRNRTTTVRHGETSLYNVAKRVYRDPSKAADIATANPPKTLGGRLKVGERLRLP